MQPLPSVSFLPGQAVCRQGVWSGYKHGAEAAKQHCLECPLFKRPAIAHRVNALSKFGKFLARLGVIPYNFIADVVTDYWEDNPTRGPSEERRRNPTVEEQVQLVNGTVHPQRRFFYAASAKWWFRPNEMFLLDRYASFGMDSPIGLGPPAGFEDGFPKHPEIASFSDGGDLVYLPRKQGRPDKRRGNRWSVIDPELRPLAEQHFAWWDRTVKRDAEGRPKTTSLWITDRGTPLQQAQMYRSLFTKDCLRLGVMQPGDEDDSLRTWTAHCQRHFGEKLLQMHNVPSDWCIHFRGDASKDARGSYFKPRPEQIRQKYLELVPQLGFTPFPQVPPANRSPRQ